MLCGNSENIAFQGVLNIQCYMISLRTNPEYGEQAHCCCLFGLVVKG